MKLNSLLIVSLVLLSGNAAWAGCGPPQCPWPVVDCQKACATCGAKQACYCDPFSGFRCEKGPQYFSLFINDENGLPVIQEESMSRE